MSFGNLLSMQMCALFRRWICWIFMFWRMVVLAVVAAVAHCPYAIAHNRDRVYWASHKEPHFHRHISVSLQINMTWTTTISNEFRSYFLCSLWHFPKLIHLWLRNFLQFIICLPMDFKNTLFLFHFGLIAATAATATIAIDFASFGL